MARLDDLLFYLPGTRDALRALVSASIPTGLEEGLVQLVAELLCSRTSFWGVVRYVVSTESRRRSLGTTGERLIRLAFLNSAKRREHAAAHC